MIELRPVEREHLHALFALKVAPAQAGLVALNAESIAEAAYEPGAWLRGIWAGGAPVGLLLMVDTGGMALEPDLHPGAT